MIATITIITDIKPGEPDILSDCSFNDLQIYDLDGNKIVATSAPTEGWKHCSLEAFVTSISERTQGGAEAYLGTTWIGSTEV